MVHYSRSDIIQMIAVVILISINLALLYNGLTISCDKCTISFSNSHVSGVELEKPKLVAIIEAQELYNNFNNGTCMIKFDKNMGFYLT